MNIHCWNNEFSRFPDTLLRPKIKTPARSGKWWGSLTAVEIIDTNRLPEDSEDLRDIRRLEQDAWSHGINEYLMCDSCDKVYGKRDIYGMLPQNIQKLLVSDLERILWVANITCPCCSEKMKPIYGEQYIECIRERYRDRAYLAVLRENCETTEGRRPIRGFIDGYIWGFDEVYDREFKQYYGTQFEENEMKSYIEERVWYKLPSKVLFWTALAMDERYRSMNSVYQLLKWFFGAMDPNEEIVCISEAAGWTNVCKIYLSMWAKAVGINETISPEDLQWKAADIVSDIYVQPGIVEAYQKGLQHPRKFWRKVLSTEMAS